MYNLNQLWKEMIKIKYISQASLSYAVEKRNLLFLYQRQGGTAALHRINFMAAWRICHGDEITTIFNANYYA